MCRTKLIMESVKLKHKEWRRIAKKQRRKRLRQNLARVREKDEETLRLKLEQDPKYIVWQSEQKALELFKIQEEERIREEENQKWLDAELEAQKKWRELQIKLASIHEQKAKQQELIKKEWEEQQRKLKDEKEIKEKITKEKQEKYEAMMQKIDDYINKGGEMPTELKEPRDTNPSKPPCPFFTKIGACRFGDSCSRNHQRPGISKVLLIRNFYSHFGIEQCFQSEYGNDVLLEYDEKETYAHFKEFFFDTIAEFKKYGRVVQYKVCCNSESHLRGNVYVEYDKTRDAAKAYKQFQGRWYGGKQLNVEFSGVLSWKNAICGMFFKKSCHKGRTCNFLHVFQNPGNLFYTADRDLHRKELPSTSAREKTVPTPKHTDPCHSSRHREESFEDDISSTRNWRWSESPEHTPSQSENNITKKALSKKHRYDSPYRTSSRSERDSRRNSYRKSSSSRRSQNASHSNRSERSSRSDEFTKSRKHKINNDFISEKSRK